MNDTNTAGFQFVPHWKLERTPADDEPLLVFWKNEGALPNPAQAKERLSQVVLHACDATGAMAGVCTAVPLTHPRMAQPLYYYRCFVGKAWRKSRLVFTMLIRAFDVLEEYARANDFPCIGVILELENSRFGETLRSPVWPSTGFVYIGKGPRGLDLRVRYFHGARLKKAKT
jgi:hypothetical protein